VLLQKFIRRTNPYIRQLLVGWISVLDQVCACLCLVHSHEHPCPQSTHQHFPPPAFTLTLQVPEIQMLDWLPDLMDGLFNMLSDENRELKHVREGGRCDAWCTRHRRHD
jgi:vacuole morphology and inheritance protein 14